MSTKSSSISHSPLYPLTSGFSLAVVGVLLAASSASAAQWVNNFSYGGSMSGDLYVPTTVKASPGIVVSLHYCGGTSSNAHGWFQSLADQYGFVIIAPQAGGNCFDATPARSGERDSISKMVQYVITQNHANAARVFASGASSGACMTNALLAAYPDVFAAGSVLAGVPAGAWTGGNAYGWTTPTNRTAQQWGDLVRNADSGFSGARPRVQLWHGTGDTTLTYSSNFPAEVAQWTNVLGVSDADSTKSTFQGSQDSWARTSYKNGAGTIVLETNVAQNAPHDLSGRGLWGDVVRFFGLDKDVSGTGGAGSGGASSVGSSGGAKATGGANATGGYGATGGSKSTGGSNAAGGSNATGGRSTASTSATGGVNTTGGSKSVGGSNTSGGSNNTGGANATAATRQPERMQLGASTPQAEPAPPAQAAPLAQPQRVREETPQLPEATARRTPGKSRHPKAAAVAVFPAPSARSALSPHSRLRYSESHCDAAEASRAKGH